MGIIRRRRNDSPEVPEPSKLSSLELDDVYVLVETSLMTAAHRLGTYRRSPKQDKEALMAWIVSDLETALLGCKDLSQRR